MPLPESLTMQVPSPSPAITLRDSLSFGARTGLIPRVGGSTVSTNVTNGRHFVPIGASLTRASHTGIRLKHMG